MFVWRAPVVLKAVGFVFVYAYLVLVVLPQCSDLVSFAYLAKTESVILVLVLPASEQ